MKGSFLWIKRKLLENEMKKTNTKRVDYRLTVKDLMPCWGDFIFVLKNKTRQLKDDGWIEQKRTRGRETSGVDTAIL